MSFPLKVRSPASSGKGPAGGNKIGIGLARRVIHKAKERNLSQARYGIACDSLHLPKITLSQEHVDAAYREVFAPENEIRPMPASAYNSSNWSELFEQFYRERIVYARSNETLLLRFIYNYEIDLDEIETEGDLLRWVLHLCEKTWMTSERLHHFIEAVGTIKKLNIYA